MSGGRHARRIAPLEVLVAAAAGQSEPTAQPVVTPLAHEYLRLAADERKDPVLQMLLAYFGSTLLGTGGPLERVEALAAKEPVARERYWWRVGDAFVPGCVVDAAPESRPASRPWSGAATASAVSSSTPTGRRRSSDDASRTAASSRWPDPGGPSTASRGSWSTAATRP